MHLKYTEVAKAKAKVEVEAEKVEAEAENIKHISSYFFILLGLIHSSAGKLHIDNEKVYISAINDFVHDFLICMPNITYRKEYKEIRYTECSPI